MTLQKNVDQVVNHFNEFPDFWYQERKHEWDEAQYEAWNQCAQLNYHRKYEEVLNRVQSYSYFNNRTVSGALLALVTYDDAGKYLDLSSEKLKMIIGLSEHPAAILLLHAVLAFEEAKKG